VTNRPFWHGVYAAPAGSWCSQVLPTTRPGSELLHDGFHSDGFVSSNEGDFTQIRRLSDSFKDE
jgi:hypothetical protein